MFKAICILEEPNSLWHVSSIVASFWPIIYRSQYGKLFNQHFYFVLIVNTSMQELIQQCNYVQVLNAFGLYFPLNSLTVCVSSTPCRNQIHSIVLLFLFPEGLWLLVLRTHNNITGTPLPQEPPDWGNSGSVLKPAQLREPATDSRKF